MVKEKKEQESISNPSRVSELATKIHSFIEENKEDYTPYEVIGALECEKMLLYIENYLINRESRK